MNSAIFKNFSLENTLDYLTDCVDRGGPEPHEYEQLYCDTTIYLVSS